MNTIKKKNEQLKTNLTELAGADVSTKLQDVKNKGKLVLTAVTFIFLPVNTIIEQLLIKEIVTFWQVFVTTTPLTLGIMILTYSFLRNHDIGLNQFIIFGLLLVAGNLLGFASGLPGLEQAYNQSSNIIFGTVAHLLVGYFLTYGWQMIVSSLIIGIFLGWMWNKFFKRIYF